jgi:uncharacterized protein (DUF1684 family)
VGILDVLDWRRRVARLYAEVRTEAERDVASAHARWRSGRDDLLRHHPQSPIPEAERARFKGAAVAAYDPTFRFVVAVDEAEPARVEVPTGTDGIVPFERIGRVQLHGVGDLDVWWLGSYGGGVFVPIKDALAGTATYGGGRYLLDTVKGADLGSEGDRLVVDLNFAYNPSCAYDPAWSCPLAPSGNVVAAEVRAGELTVSPE